MAAYLVTFVRYLLTCNCYLDLVSKLGYYYNTQAIILFYPSKHEDLIEG